VPENVTDEPVNVNPVIDDVSQEPVDMVMVDDEAVRVAAAVDVRLLVPNVTVALERVKVPAQVSEFPNVVFIDVLTVILFAVSSMLIVPPDVSTIISDVPTV
jgi:hypothetical protein